MWPAGRRLGGVAIVIDNCDLDLPCLELEAIDIEDEFLAAGPACFLTSGARKENAECVQPCH